MAAAICLLSSAFYILFKTYYIYIYPMKTDAVAMVKHGSNIIYGQGPYSYLLQSVITIPRSSNKGNSRQLFHPYWASSVWHTGSKKCWMASNWATVHKLLSYMHLGYRGSAFGESALKYYGQSCISLMCCIHMHA